MAISHITILGFLSLSLTLTLIPLSFSEKCHPNDKKALLQFKEDLNNPHILSTWNPKTDCCSEWYSIICHRENNRVIEFGFSDIDIKLPIPAAVGDLPYLQNLTLDNTNLTGQIPAAISKLSNLIFLELPRNLLTGPIPSFLGNLKKLQHIYLSENSLTGSLPASLSKLPDLYGVLIEHNKLSGSIPDSFGDFKHQDMSLFMAHNQLSGPIPRRLGYANFSLFDVSNNKLTGDISFMFGKNKSITHAYFATNMFEFDFSKVEIPGDLSYLDLSHNKIYGSIPKGLTQVELESFDLSYNRLCGEIPLGGNLQDFVFASAYSHNKCLCGSPLPKCVMTSFYSAFL